MIINVFEQFEVHLLFVLVSNYSVWLILLVLVVYLLSVSFNRRSMPLVGNNYALFLILVTRFIGNMATEISKSYRHSKTMIWLMLSVVVLNVMGMIPYSYSICSSLVFSFSIGLGVWFGKLFYGLSRHGFLLVRLFAPRGIPFVLLPMFVILEWISFFVPAFSLSVRLFANVMSGHVLLKVLFMFVLTALLTSFGGIEVLAEVALIALLVLETSVGMIQGYILTLLSCVYIADMHDGGHGH